MKLALKGRIWCCIAVLAFGFAGLLVVMCRTGSMTRSQLRTASDSLVSAAMSSQDADVAYERLAKHYSDVVTTRSENVLRIADEVDANDVATAMRNVKDKLPADTPRQKAAAALFDRFLRLRAKSNEVYGAVVHKAETAQTEDQLDELADETKAVQAAMQQLHKDITSDFRPEMQSVIASSRRQEMFGLILFVIVILACGAVVEWLIVRGVTRTLAAASADLKHGAEQIEVAAAEISSSANNLAQGASEQAASLEETSASAQDVKSMTQHNAENSKNAAALMSATAKEIEGANLKLQTMAESMSEINSESLQMKKTMKVIDDIAFQTNILALNAAVEAARAGEAGAGFAVVADEVRNLAQRCAAAAKDTAEQIERAITTAANGKERLHEVEEAVRAITKNGSQARVLVDEVSAASQEQAKALTQIAVAIEQVEGITQRAAASAEQSAAASEELNAQSHAMHDVVENLVKVIGHREVAKLETSKSNKKVEVTPKEELDFIAAK